MTEVAALSTTRRRPATMCSATCFLAADVNMMSVHVTN